MKIFIGSDHAGFELKNKLVEYLKSSGHDVSDFGAHKYDEGDDYPDFVAPVAQAVAKEPAGSRGIILGGSGQGEAICANRFSGVRAVVFYGNPERSDLFEDSKSDLIKLSREHNDANILSLGARFLDFETAVRATDAWLNTAFSGEERHLRRIKKIDGRKQLLVSNQ